ncbi:helix-turn-helix domain-containing protein [Paractinoplanes hotanensis]|uniref:Helix-turn-helix domain-containing protein n=1 Tax=Paractinoplanes hotanensis TaxID=2906497 RepID=A0ABT0XY20_9ACTN|nr:helix-turn-helix transcriptional regulator [Actinoplanes hotanensis]MCM4078659.1 helix-turn-helix domain-containing protein [Actinoplanes hotanensis]
MDALVGELRGLRGEAGLTLRELSLKVHVSDSSLSRYFTGQALPPWEVVVTLADLGGVTFRPGRTFDGTGTPS